MRTAFGLRLLLALTLMGWGQFVFAEDYYWSLINNTSQPYPSAIAACEGIGRSYGASSTAFNYVSFELAHSGFQGTTTFRCYWRRTHKADNTPASSHQFNVVRYGNACPTGATYNTTTGGCESPPVNCQPLTGQRFSFFANVPNGGSSLPGEYICSQGCRAAWSGECGTNNDGVSACWGLATYNGSVCQTGDTPSGVGTPPTDPSEPTDPTDPTDPTEPTDPTDPPPTCGPGYSWSGTTCVKDPPKVCDPSTGEVCPPTDPTDPTNPTDPDNPGDGGDGDGDGSGDGDADTGSGEPGEGDQEKLGEKIDKTNSLLDGISKALGNLGDAFKEFAEDALGEKYDGEGDTDESSIGEAAAGLAGNLVGSFGQGLNESLEEQEALNQGTLADLPNLVGNDWFGPGSVAYSAINLIDGVLPRSTSCSAFT
ncbi:hypothetical protein HP436_12150, partial [Pseudomonas sp. CrR14]|nr:hypothetical protein [Pseudomonas sp. CrR14]